MILFPNIIGYFAKDLGHWVCVLHIVSCEMSVVTEMACLAWSNKAESPFTIILIFLISLVYITQGPSRLCHAVLTGMTTLGMEYG